VTSGARSPDAGDRHPGAGSIPGASENEKGGVQDPALRTVRSRIYASLGVSPPLSKNGLSRSMGRGKMMVEFFSVAISVRVCM
jgi:hypothetical protein